MVYCGQVILRRLIPCTSQPHGNLGSQECSFQIQKYCRRAAINMEKHHGCLNTKVIINYFQEHFPDLTPALVQDLHPEINALDNPLEFLTDSNNWVCK